jgi:hypothetical protein
MKRLLILGFLALIGCSAMLSNPPTVPEGYKACTSDKDCHNKQFCGFAKVDTYAVCRD